ncbi:hypothetical protein ACH0AH_02685 [Microbacterium paludicola]|uniref:WXG100 family type VII secretion target n=1 Tax=Microbacterium paludicola TaxID=300019 RepID=A0A4Y9FSN6_9MICO|nr:hypothetical protein [Microbacterium paludicola]MBF0817013.1 hypothetical protein [Microbacterium paludicola]TFU32267.1 hypothetical protein E4U02_11360 [Microbacterium paludicola]
MAEQQADTTQLRNLTQTLQSLVEYCEALRAGAGGFAYMLPNEWQGPASQRFMGQFETWAAGAEGMRQAAEALKAQAEAAEAAYSSAIEAETSRWDQLSANLGG